MKKRILAFVFLVICAILIYLLHSVLPDFYFNAGKDFYSRKDYPNAYKNLKSALRLRDTDRQIRYYYVQTLLNLSPTLEVQKEIFKISQYNLPDTADLLADRQISKWKNQIFLNVGENYIEQVPYNNKILRWDMTKFPIKVLLDKSMSQNIPPYYEPAIKRAFLQWQSSTRFIKFKFVDSDADIVVKIMTSQRNSCDQQSCKYVVAFTTPSINGDILKRMDIVFYDSNNLGNPFAEKDVYNTALHEIGHALGIMGHSPNPSDLMYMETDANGNENNYLRSDFQVISNVDLNTLKLLYMMIPDITNTELSQYKTNRQFYSPIVMGSDEQINSRKIDEAKRYIQGAPNLPNGYIDLASAYAEQKEFNIALENLEKALEVSSNDEERFIIYYNFAVTYMNIQDWDNAVKYVQMAKQIKPDSTDVDGVMAAINFNKGNKAFAKQSYIDSLAKDPSNILDSINLARIYLREFNFPQAGKVMNNLVSANPEAKNDPKVRKFGFLMFFFK